MKYNRIAMLHVAFFFVIGVMAPPQVDAQQINHMLLGNPSSANDDESDPDNYLMKKTYYALSYNNAKGTPNWVSWHLSRDDVADAPRKSSFSADNDLPEGFTLIRHKDYTNSGFDRGHMCPHCDRSRTKIMSYSTFIMTNVIPQTAEVNRQAWNQLELYLRTLAVSEGKELYIISGPAGIGGHIDGEKIKTIADGTVTVPSQCWKIAVILDDEDGNDLDRIDESTRVIAVVMPNDDSVGEDWAGFRTTVSAIEQLTGYTFFDQVPAPARNALKVKEESGHVPHFHVDHEQSCLKQAGGE